MQRSRRFRTGPVGQARPRRPGGGWRSRRALGPPAGTGGRWLALLLVAGVLVAAGYGLGRWTARERLAAGAADDGPMPATRGSETPDDSGGDQRPGPDHADRPVVSATGRDDAAPDDTPASPDRAAAAAPEELDAAHAVAGAPSRPGSAGSAAPAVTDTAPPRAGARVAIVIDDLGRSLEVIDELRGFAVALTYAVLPFETHTHEVAARLTALDEEFLCHLPMAARRGEDPGPGALDVGMRPRELRATTRRALEAVPGAAGVNNHMGSALSEDRAAMAAVLEVVRAQGLFFLDSRTSSASLGYALARDLGVPAAERQVFLDGDRHPSAIRREFGRLLELADGGGPAIAIGHPYPETLAVLAEEIPRAVASGYRFVRVSELVATE